MAQEGDLTPRLGRIGNKGRRGYLPKVLKAAHRAGGVRPTRGGTAKTASRGRGAGLTCVLRTGRRTGPAARRGIVKARFTRLAGSGVTAAAAHLRYLQRDGTTRDGARGQLYARDTDHADGRAFMAQGAGDRHQFRFIVAPEDGDQYDDLKGLTRRLMAQMEDDLGTRLSWVAVDHFNTGHPHTHIVVRGVDDQGQDLVIARDYLSEGLRLRLESQLELDLGPRSAREIAARETRERETPGLTRLDRRLLALQDARHELTVPPTPPDQHAALTARLHRLERLGLSEALDDNRWRLSPDLALQLERLGRHAELQKMAEHDLVAMGRGQEGLDVRVHLPSPAHQPPVAGRLLRHGLIDGADERTFALVESLDGRVHAVDLGTGAHDLPAKGGLVAIAFGVAEVRGVDRTIAEVARRNNGRYDIEAHLAVDPSATSSFAETHLRRLEAIRRATRGVVREADGGFRVPEDYLARALAFERQRLERAPAEVHVLSPLPVERLPTYPGATWLDLAIETPPERVADSGFGRLVRAAVQQRQHWLLDQNLAVEIDGQVQLRAGALAALRQRDLQTAATAWAARSGLAYREAERGERIDGIYRGRLDLPSGRFAVVERAHDFTLVPWRPVLDPHRDKRISGAMGDTGIDWTIGRGRGRSPE